MNAGDARRQLRGGPRPSLTQASRCPIKYRRNKLLALARNEDYGEPFG